MKKTREWAYTTIAFLTAYLISDLWGSNVAYIVIVINLVGFFLYVSE